MCKSICVCVCVWLILSILNKPLHFWCLLSGYDLRWLALDDRWLVVHEALTPLALLRMNWLLSANLAQKILVRDSFKAKISTLIIQFKLQNNYFFFENLPVWRLLDLVDTYNPMFRSESLFQVLQAEVLVADLDVTSTVESWRSSEVKLFKHILMLNLSIKWLFLAIHFINIYSIILKIDILKPSNYKMLAKYCNFIVSFKKLP